MTQLFKPSEAAKRLLNHLTGQPGVTQQRVQQLCEKGRLGQRVGGGWVISLEEIETYNKLPRPTERGRRKRKTPSE